MRKKLVICLILILILSLSGCSKGNPTVLSPDVTNDDNIPSILIENADISNHNLAGIWSFHLNPDFKEAEIVAKRDAEIHYNVTQIIPAPQITINGYDPATNILDVDVTITNPYPVDVYDVRLIIFTDSVGHKLVNDDGWTSLFDIPGGLPINPFKAYAKDILNRKFTGNTQHTENLQILLPGGNTNVTFGIDVSYPDNCEEPYKIGNFTQGILYDTVGSSTTCQVEVYDHQDNVNSVSLFCPTVTGTTLVSFNYTCSNIWELELINNSGASEGIHDGFLITRSVDSGILALYDNVEIIVTHQTNIGWVRTWGGLGWDKGANCAVDNSGNIYVTGYFEDLVDFDPGPGIDEHTSNGAEDVFLTKFDKNGNFLWARTWGGSGIDNCDETYPLSEGPDFHRGIDTDHSGNVYVSGNFRELVDFNPGQNPDEVDEFKSNGNTDVFVCKYDSNGNYKWTITFGGNDDYILLENCYDLSIDDTSNVYITGRFSDTADFDPSSGVVERTADGFFDTFLCKYNSEGQFEWVNTWGGFNDEDCGFGIKAVSSGYILITGEFNGQNVDFDPGPDQDLHSSMTVSSAYLCKYDLNGTFIWAKSWGSDSFYCGCNGYDIETDINGDIFVGGGFTDDGIVDFDPGSGVENRSAVGEADAYISKFDQSGNFNWVITWGGAGANIWCTVVLCDNTGNLYASTRLKGLVDFDPGPSEIWFNAQNSKIAISKFNNDGIYQWVRVIGGSHHSCGIGLDKDDTGNVFIAGYFHRNNDEIDFDPGPNEELYQAIGKYDAFLLKLLPNGYWE
jgi:hypothetical protein